MTTEIVEDIGINLGEGIEAHVMKVIASPLPRVVQVDSKEAVMGRTGVVFEGMDLGGEGSGNLSDVVVDQGVILRREEGSVVDLLFNFKDDVGEVALPPKEASKLVFVGSATAFVRGKATAAEW